MLNAMLTPKDISPELNDALIQRHHVMQRTGKKVLQDALLDALKKYPAVRKVSWHSYIPSFNDGDLCEFTFNGPYVDTFDLNFEQDSRDSDEDEEDELPTTLAAAALAEIDKEEQPDPHPREHPEYWNQWKEWREAQTARKHAMVLASEGHRVVFGILACFDTRDFEEFYGPNIRVTITKEGIENNEYDCGY